MREGINTVNIEVVPAGIDNRAENKQNDDELHGSGGAYYLKPRKVNEVEEIEYTAHLNEQYYPIRIVD